MPRETLLVVAAAGEIELAQPNQGKGVTKREQNEAHIISMFARNMKRFLSRQISRHQYNRNVGRIRRVWTLMDRGIAKTEMKPALSRRSGRASNE
jgi:hypothetical protein